MAVQVTPLAPGLPATTAIQDPAARQFANAVADILRTSQTADGAVAQLERAAGALSKGGGGSAPPAISQWLYSSELYQRLSSAIERVDTSAQEAIVAEAMARAQAITIEQENRASAIAAEASARADAIFAEAQLRAEAINAEAAARIQAIAAEREDRAAELAAERAERIQVLIDEAVARQAAISAEASARADAITQEQRARAQAIAAEAAAREAETLARIQAINAEAAARMAALLQERDDRIAAISAEHDAWVSAIAAEALARGTAISVETVARQEADLALASQITTLSAVVDGNVSAIQSEVTARTTADEALAQQLTTLVGVVGDNTAAIQAETTARTTADSALAQQITTLSATVGENDGAARALINAESSARASADAAIAQQITTLSAAVGENASSIQTEQTTRSNQYESLAQQITLISAGVGEQFDFKKIWYFDDGLEGWSGNGEPIVSGGWLRPANHSAAPYVQSPDALAVSANTYGQVRLRIRKHGSPTWAGALWWRRSVDSDWSVSRSMSLDEPTYDGNGIGLISVSAKWSDVIDQVRIELSEEQTDTDYFAIDWLAIGRPSPGASTAALYEESLARALADSALASSISSLSASVTSNYGTLSAAINNESSARADADSAIAQQITTLTATVSKNDSDTRALIFEESVARADADGALASQIDALSATIETNDTAVRALVSEETTARVTADSALAQQITAVTAAYQSGDANTLASANDYADSAAGAVLVSAQSAVLSESTARANADEALAQQITTVVAEYTAADAQTLTSAAALIADESTARANADEALAQQITTLSATVDENAAAIQSEATARAQADSAEALAREALSSRVTSAEGAISSQAAQISDRYTKADTDAAIASASLSLIAAYQAADAVALSSANDYADATAGAALTSALASVSNEATARADADQALAQQITTLTANYQTADAATLSSANNYADAAAGAALTSAQAALQTESEARANADGALASQITTLLSAVETNDADVRSLISDESSARASADGALASQVSALAATVTTNDSSVRALVDSESLARASADTAIASQVSGLAAIVDGNDADVRALILDEAAARASAIDAEANARSSLATQLRGAYTGTDATQLQTGLIASERTARITADENLQQQINMISAASSGDFQDLVAAVTEESTARIIADEALASNVGTITARLDNVAGEGGSPTNKTLEATLIDERSARVTGDAAIASDLSTLAATVTTNDTTVRGLIASESTARSEGDTALAQQITTLIATVDDNDGAVRSLISNESAARADADGALAESITTVASATGVNAAAIVTEAETRTTNDLAIVQALDTLWSISGASKALSQDGKNLITNWQTATAQEWQTLQAEVLDAGGNTLYAAVAAESQARADFEGKVAASWMVKAEVDVGTGKPYVAGIALGAEGQGGAATSEFAIRADKFSLLMPGYGDYVPFAIGDFGPEFSGLTSWSNVTGASKPQDGATRNVFRGDWAASTPYAVGDIVLKDGNGWSCTQPHTSSSSNQPPASGNGNDWWALYAVKGSDGAQGLHALTVLVPNSAHTLPAASDGAVASYTGSGTTIQVFEGTTALSAVSSITANGQFTIGTPTQVPASTITVGARSYADTTATVAQHSAMVAGTDSVVVTYPITVRRTDGTTVTLSATQTLTKSKAGVKGDAGESAKAAFLAATSQVFQIAKSGTITPSSITLTATGQNVTGSPTFSVTSGTATLTGTGNTRTLASTELTTDAATIKITWDGQEDYVTVVKVREGADGTSGANAIVAVLSNEAHTVPTDSAGNNGVFTGANTTMTIYNGTADDSANWTVTATVSNVTGSLSGKTYTVTGLSADTGYVDLTAARSGYASIVKRFVLTKSKAGVTGAQGPAGPAVVVTANRALTFTATDGALDGSQADIVLTASVSGIPSPTYAWTFSGLQTNPTASTTSSQTITAAQFGTSKSAVVTCTVNGSFVDQVTIVRLEKSTAEAGATVGATAAQAAELQSLAKAGANLVANSAFASTIGGNMAPGWVLYNNGAVANVQWWYRGGGMFGTDAQRVKTLAATTNTFGVYTGFAQGGGVRYVPGWGHYISFYARAVSGEPGFAGLTMSGLANNNLWTNTQTIENPPLLNDVYQRYVFYGVANAGADLTAGLLWITANGSKPANASLDICCVQVEAAVSGAATAWKPSYYDTIGAGRPITTSNVTTYIADAAIGAAQIGSINLVGTSNFAVKTATSGARMDMDSRRIKVFDENDVLRVQLGDLTV